MGAFVKTAHKVLILIGLFFIAVCVFLVPRYYAVNKARDAMAAGSSAMNGGDFALGAARMRYALEQYALANGGVDTATKNGARAAIAAAAVSNPLESLPGLALLADYKIGLTCEQKQAVAMPLLRGANGALKKADAANAGAALYAAALWLQGCPFDEQKLAQYNAMLDEYAAMDAGAAPWLANARSGQTVDAAYAPPVLKTADLEKLEVVDIKTRAAEFTASLKHSVTRLASAGASMKIPGIPGAKSESAKSAKPAAKKPAAPAPMVQTVDTTQTATATTAADTIAKEKQPENPAPAPEKKQTPEPEAKKPASPDKQGKLVSTMPPPARGMSASQASAAIRDSVAAKGVKVASVTMPGNGAVVVARIKTNSVKGALLDEVSAVLNAAHQHAGTGETGVSAEQVTIHVEDSRGNKRHTFGVKMHDFARYKAGTIDKTTFLKNHMTVE
jgi:hypothetical protein